MTENISLETKGDKLIPVICNEIIFLKCGQDLSSLQKTLIAQSSAFTMNGSDLYEETMSRFSILSTGITLHLRFASNSFHSNKK